MLKFLQLSDQKLGVRDAYIYAKYGEEFEKFDEIEKARIRQQVTNYLNENR